MKRLLDESTDELTRSLLQAGVEDRPPPGNQRQLIIAMGAGGALGLFSSNAFAWLGTTAGKVTAAGVAVSVAGAVFVGGPLLVGGASDDGAGPRLAARSGADGSVEPAGTPARASDEPAAAPLAAEPSSGPAALPLHEPAAMAREGVARELVARDEAAGARAPRARTAPEGRVDRAASGMRRNEKAVGRKARARASVQPLANGGRTRSVGKPVAPLEAAATADARRAALDAEVRLVDDMHAAARRDDREALARAVATYRSEFPSGQLRKEVDDFEASLERVDAP